jgi:hypothetical protein
MTVEQAGRVVNPFLSSGMWLALRHPRTNVFESVSPRQVLGPQWPHPSGRTPVAAPQFILPNPHSSSAATSSWSHTTSSCSSSCGCSAAGVRAAAPPVAAAGVRAAVFLGMSESCEL